MLTKRKKTIVVIVAHPDDETLWSGGTILSHPKCDWFIVSLCRGKDPERSAKFFKALEALNAVGIMGDLDDGPEQQPLDLQAVEKAILNLLPLKHFDMIISHSPSGEYTKHLRHEEIGRAVIKLWHSNQIAANCLWAFAYNDENKKYLPKTIEKASVITNLSHQIWTKKYNIITKIYGFEDDSWEAQTTPKTEAFWQFGKPSEAMSLLKTVK
jgi:LmbE family N-acetylglucosaminyl deacetylase